VAVARAVALAGGSNVFPQEGQWIIGIVGR
jgi:hypothetical protein